MTQKCTVNLSVPFESNKLALVAKNSIDADEVPNPDQITRTIQVEDNKLNVVIDCDDLFKLRTSLNNYIDFPSSTTSEEEALLKKYEKLEKKLNTIKAEKKVEPEVVATTSDKPVEAKNSKDVIERLKKKGQLPIITKPEKSQFKRKVQTNTPAVKATKLVDESREIISYEQIDDLFS